MMINIVDSAAHGQIWHGMMVRQYIAFLLQLLDCDFSKTYFRFGIMILQADKSLQLTVA
jgi:hypothetical protein